MQDWIDLLASGDLGTILIVIVLVIVTGGVGAAVVTGWFASKRGVRGDALTKEQNGIEGLTNLSTAQGDFIKDLQGQITALRTEYKNEMAALKADYHAEIAYSNLLIGILSDNTIPIPPRPNH